MDVKTQIQQREEKVLHLANNTLIRRCNQFFEREHHKRVAAYSSCYGSTEGQLSCLAAADRVYNTRVGAMNELLVQVEQFFSKCTAFCRFNITKPIGSCYIDCLSEFEDLLRTVEERAARGQTFLAAEGVAPRPVGV